MKFAVAAAALLLSAALPTFAQTPDAPPPAATAPAAEGASPMDGLRAWCKQNRGACKPLRNDHEAAQSACQGQPSAPDQWSDACRQARMKVKADMQTLRAAGAPLPEGGGMK
jgi:hypothetical protein